MVDASSEKEESNRRVLVVSCYGWEWQRVLILEGASNFSGANSDVQVLDLASFSSNPIKNFFKGVSGRAIRSKRIKAFYEFNRISWHQPNFEIFKSKLTVALNLLYLRNYKRKLEERWEVIYPGLVDMTNTVSIKRDDKNHRRLMKKTLVQDIVFTKLVNKCYAEIGQFDLVLVVNGRFLLNRSAATYFKNQGIPVNFIEFASSRERYQIYEKSPHSVSNRRDLFNQFMNKTDESPERIECIGKEFFIKRRNFDEQANISWTRKMTSERSPGITSQKKICTFYSTTEKEFAGVSDKPQEGSFINQFEAFSSLVDCLGDDWMIYLRRHPMALDDQKDYEKVLWSGFEKYSNVSIIQPDSDVDSYSLGMNSDLVAHFGSMIGPELVYSGHKNVISLGPTMWEDLDPTCHLHSRLELQNFLARSLGTSSFLDVLSLGYYMANFGKDFKFLNWDRSRGLWTLRE
jgi:hypothetical protein